MKTKQKNGAGMALLDMLEALAEIERIANMIRPHLELDPTKFYTMEQFEEAIAEDLPQQDMPDEGNSIETAIQSVPEQTQGEQDTSQQEFADGVVPSAANEAQIPPVQNREGGWDGRQGGGNRMMQGGNAIGLVAFVRERINNVSGQLSGEFPSTGNTAQSSCDNSFPRGQQGGGQRERQEPQDRPERNAGNNGLPGEFPGRADNRAVNRNMQRTDITSHIYLIGGSLLLLLVATLLVLRKKTKYSV